MAEGYKFQLNIKFDEGYDSPLLNITGDTPVEFGENLAAARQNADDIVETAVLLQAGYKLKKPSDGPQKTQNASWGQQGTQQSQQAPQQSQSAPAGPPPTCRHGEMVYKPGGISKRTGNAYNAFWACGSRNRNDQCPSQNA